MKTLKLLGILVALLITSSLIGQTPSSHSIEKQDNKSDDKLVVVWTTGDREVALKMIFMYTYNAQKQGWWDDITLLVWGPSSKLLSEDEELQEKVKEMQKEGVHLLACKGCADLYGVSEKLEEIGVTVRYTGTDLTEFIKERHVITF